MDVRSNIDFDTFDPLGFLLYTVYYIVMHAWLTEHNEPGKENINVLLLEILEI